MPLRVVKARKRWRFALQIRTVAKFATRPGLGVAPQGEEQQPQVAVRLGVVRPDPRRALEGGHVRVEPPREPGVQRDRPLEHGLGLVLAERERLEDAADGGIGKERESIR